MNTNEIFEIQWLKNARWLLKTPEELAAQSWLGHPVPVRRGDILSPFFLRKLLFHPHFSAARVLVHTNDLLGRISRQGARSPEIKY
jgi:hypothetical protein